MAHKILTAAALVLGFSFSTTAFAGTPKTDAKPEAKVEATSSPTKTDAKAEQNDIFYYHITSLDASGNYQMEKISSPNDEDCPGGNDACVVSTQTDRGTSTSASKAAVDANGAGFIVLDQQSLSQQ